MAPGVPPALARERSVTAADRSARPGWLAWLRPLADAIVPVTMLRGVALDTGMPTTMVVAGSLPRVQWLLDRFFAAAPVREPLGHVPAWRLARTLRRHALSADLAVARVARVSAGALGFDGDWLPVPDWVGMRIAPPFDLRAIASRSHSAAADIQRTKQCAFTCEVSRRSADLATFHRDVYLPFLRNRHRGAAVARSLRYLRRRFRRGGILWISRGGARVAGALFERRRGVLDMVAVGVMRGDLSLVREGAIGALYVHLVDYARTTGSTGIDLRGSRPSPLDGLTRYKRKWGATVYDRADVVSTTFVRWQQLTPAVESLLARLPLIFRDDGGLSAAGVADRADPESSVRALHMHELRRRILASDVAPPEVAASDVAIVPLAAGSTPRALLAAALLPAG